MIRWTTPTLQCTIPKEIDCEYIILTLKQNKVLIEKTIQSSEIVDGVFSVTYTQDETSRFQKDIAVEAQLNIINGASRLATNIIPLHVDRNLHNEEIL